jgi:hypothetical protein
VIHAVGPVWRGGGQGEADELAGCYRMSLDLAKQAGLASIAFPAISTGIFGYPVDQATGVAVETVRAWLAEKDSLERVVFCVFGDEVEQAYRQALGPPGGAGLPPGPGAAGVAGALIGGPDPAKAAAPRQWRHRRRAPRP